jgi:hypothetical protein
MLEKEWPPSGGRLRYAEVPWDTAAFGFPVYQLFVEASYPGFSDDLASLSAHLAPAHDGGALVFTKVPPTDIELLIALGKIGFYPVETQIEAHTSLADFTWERRFEGLQLRPATPVDVPALLSLARTAFRLDRYHLDPNVSDQQAGVRLEKWLAQGIERGDIVMVFEDRSSSKTIGFCLLQERSDRLVDFLLGAVETRLQGAGIGLVMYGECFLACRDSGFRNLVTRISLHNVDVLNVFAELGCRFRHPRLTVHRFIPDPS